MKRILVAYDGGEPARRALETAIDFAKAFGTPISVVSVVPIRPGGVRVDPWDDATAHEQELAEAREILAGRGVEAELLEPAGDPARTIEKVAEDGGFDTIVVGSRGLGSIGRLLQGSVSEHVATHSTATVVIAH
jgi:nucleotide-binding universal stress UspA family protein